MAYQSQLDGLIDVLHALRFTRDYYASSQSYHRRAELMISELVGGEKNRSGGQPSVALEIAKLIVEADANWNSETGLTHCGGMETRP